MSLYGGHQTSVDTSGMHTLMNVEPFAEPDEATIAGFRGVYNQLEISFGEPHERSAINKERFCVF